VENPCNTELELPKIVSDGYTSESQNISEPFTESVQSQSASFDPQEIQEEVTEIVQNTSPSFDHVYLQAEKAYMQGRYEEAATIIHQAIEDYPQKPMAYLLQGHINAYGLQHYELARESYSTVLNLATDAEFTDYANNGLNYINQTLAMEEYSQVEIKEEVVTCAFSDYYQQAEKAYIEGRYMDASGLVHQLVENYPQEPKAHLLIGHIYCQLKCYQLSQEYYNAALSLTSDIELINYINSCVNYTSVCSQGSSSEFANIFAGTNTKAVEATLTNAGNTEYEFSNTDFFTNFINGGGGNYIGTSLDESPAKFLGDAGFSKKIDYATLHNLLKAKRWREADKETRKIMLQVVSRNDYLDADSLEKFPGGDLNIINNMWIEASSGHFGFSVQRKIWKEEGSSLKSGSEWNCFCIKVGWMTQNFQYVDYSSLEFDPSSSPKGQLPLYYLPLEMYGYTQNRLDMLNLSLFRVFAQRLAVLEGPFTLSPFKFFHSTIDEDYTTQGHDGEAYHFQETINGVNFEMVQIPSGSFNMGSNENKSEMPIHHVTVPEFFMGKYPVTQAQWKTIAKLKQKNRKLNPDPSRFKGADRPVESVSWEDAVEFCERLQAYTGNPYRLPSEAEWEYSCRAGTDTLYNFGDMIDPVLSNYGRSCKGTTTVGRFPGNTWGLFDCHGNVWEWCADVLHQTYGDAPTDGSAWTIIGADFGHRVGRGGSWADPPGSTRSASRYPSYARSDRSNLCGFRIALSVVSGFSTSPKSPNSEGL
jgi:formylglycine-generating enzyme required for sulfatase activity/Tfp pilus assembly protein PilF